MKKEHDILRWSLDRNSRTMTLERLEMFLSAGMPLRQALGLSAEGLSRRASDVVNRSAVLVESGRLLSDTARASWNLPGAVISLIECGESSGDLAKALHASLELLERDADITRKCLSAMAYPCVIGVAATALAVGLVRGIMPQILPLLTGLHSDLPFLTKVVMRLSTWSMDWGVFAGMGSVLTAVIALWSYKRFEHVKLAVQHCLLHTPIIGALAERYALTTFFRSFGMLMESGMTADKAYIRAASAPTMIPIKRRLLSGIAALEKGEKIGHILDQKGVPRSISPLISSGESSGRLPSALSRAAVILDREIDHSLKRLTALIEPVMMLGMGCMVGSIALSIMMPIYDISKTLQH